jgi:hypothetical protein
MLRLPSHSADSQFLLLQDRHYVLRFLLLLFYRYEEGEISYGFLQKEDSPDPLMLDSLFLKFILVFTK